MDDVLAREAAETYLLITSTIGWDLHTYENWLAATCTRLSSGLTAGE